MVLDEATQAKVKKQVEFYFSDSNLPRDKFLLEKVAENEEGYVDIALLCFFSRMNQLLKTNYKDAASVPDEKVADVAAALEGSEVLSLSEDKKRVKRAQPLRASEEVSKEVDARSLYASPFPFDTTLDAITEFFGKAGAVNSVRMRRHLTSKDFKGSVFVEFANQEEAGKVAAMALEFEGAPLKLEPKLEYIKRKQDERHERANSPHPKRAEASGEGAAAGEGDAAAAGGSGEAANQGEAEPAAVPEFTRACLLHFDFGADAETAEVRFGTVKDSFGGRGAGVAFVDYKQGDKSGYVRFNTPEQAQETVGKLEEGSTMQVAGLKAAIRLLEGEEEEQYVVKSHKAREAAKARAAEKGGRGGGRGGGGRGGRRGGGRGGRGRGQKRQRDE